jgi:hypothetical protein
MEREFIINLLLSFLFTENKSPWFLQNNSMKIRIERFGQKVNYQELDENDNVMRGYWLLQDKTLYGPYTDHMSQ